MPKVTEVTFKDHMKERGEPYLKAKVKIESMYSLFQMIAPQQWIFYGFSDREDESKSSRFKEITWYWIKDDKHCYFLGNSS